MASFSEKQGNDRCQNGDVDQRGNFRRVFDARHFGDDGA
jgi:hypothetical protein